MNHLSLIQLSFPLLPSLPFPLKSVCLIHTHTYKVPRGMQNTTVILAIAWQFHVRLNNYIWPKKKWKYMSTQNPEHEMFTSNFIQDYQKLEIRSPLTSERINKSWYFYILSGILLSNKKIQTTVRCNTNESQMPMWKKPDSQDEKHNLIYMKFLEKVKV